MNDSASTFSEKLTSDVRRRIRELYLLIQECCDYFDDDKTSVRLLELVHEMQLLVGPGE
jgi:hypothetical protein